MSMAVEIHALINRDTRCPIFPSLVAVGSPWRTKDLDLDDMALRGLVT